MVPCPGNDQCFGAFIRLEKDVVERINRQAPQSRQGNNTTEKTSKVAIVTGASRGIGAAIAERLESDGFTVAVNRDQWRDRLMIVRSAISKGPRSSRADRCG